MHDNTTLGHEAGKENKRGEHKINKHMTCVTSTISIQAMNMSHDIMLYYGLMLFLLI